jgi:hypothetical protein
MIPKPTFVFYRDCRFFDTNTFVKSECFDFKSWHDGNRYSRWIHIGVSHVFPSLFSNAIVFRKNNT